MIDAFEKRPRIADGHGWCCFINGVFTSVTGSLSERPMRVTPVQPVTCLRVLRPGRLGVKTVCEQHGLYPMAGMV